MARYDVYQNTGRQSSVAPFLVDVQSNHLGQLASRVVIPLRRLDSFPDVKLPLDLTPIVVFEGIECFMDTPQLAAVPVRELGNALGSLNKQQPEIVNALDRLFGAF